MGNSKNNAATSPQAPNAWRNSIRVTRETKKASHRSRGFNFAVCAYLVGLCLSVPPQAANAQELEFFNTEDEAELACLEDRNELQPPPPTCHHLVCTHYVQTPRVPGAAGYSLYDHCAGWARPRGEYMYPRAPCPPAQDFVDPGVCQGPLDVGQNFGPPGGGTCTGVGNPCDPATGNKYHTETDYRSGDGGLTFTRYYNSQFTTRHYLYTPFPDELGLGVAWTSTFHRGLQIDGRDVIIRQATGRGEPFICTGTGPCTGDPNTKLLLDQDATGYTVTLGDGATDRYDISGRLLTEADRSGKTTTYAYDTWG